MRKLNLHWFCTQNHILEPFSVRRACTQCYITSEPYPRPSQIWCQNVRETRKKIVIKCRGESFARCRVIARYVEGGAIMGPPPPSLIRVKALSHWRRRRRDCCDSGDSGDQKMACALTKETSPRLPRLISRGDSGDQHMACALMSRRRLRDLLETEKVSKKKSNMFEFSATPRRPG